jgi:TolA-binding protein
VKYKLAPSEVADIQVARPKELDPAISQVKAERYAAALPTLEKIMRDYTMLQYDVIAAQYLAQSYLKTKDPRKAVMMCRKVADSNPRAADDPGFAAIYWQGLLETEQYSTLEKALKDAIANGPREMAAVAQIKRGDIARQKGNLDDALIDGYLRTVVFFQAVKTVQPEALYKAAKCFEEKGKHSHAEKMRKRLLSGYPQSEYAKRVTSGA